MIFLKNTTTTLVSTIAIATILYTIIIFYYDDEEEVNPKQHRRSGLGALVGLRSGQRRALRIEVGLHHVARSS